MAANGDIDLSECAFHLTNTEQYRSHRSGQPIMLEVMAKVCFTRIADRPTFKLVITDPTRPFQPASIDGTILQGSMFTQQDILAGQQGNTDEVAARLAELTAPFHPTLGEGGAVPSGVINNDGEFWD
ncbi:hypothetical protein FOMPIDRAFT_94254, partial [Fomitopsis schrenkii]